MHSPLVIRLGWGQMYVEGLGSGRDFKLYPGGGRQWDWEESETHHFPGILPEDVEELLDHHCDFVVLSSGMHQRLHVAPQTQRYHHGNPSGRAFL